MRETVPDWLPSVSKMEPLLNFFPFMRRRYIWHWLEGDLPLSRFFCFHVKARLSMTYKKAVFLQLIKGSLNSCASWMQALLRFLIRKPDLAIIDPMKPEMHFDQYTYCVGFKSLEWWAVNHCIGKSYILSFLALVRLSRVFVPIHCSSPFPQQLNDQCIYLFHFVAKQRGLAIFSHALICFGWWESKG